MTNEAIVLTLIGLILPLLSALLTRAHWPNEIAGLCTLVLSAVEGIVAEATHGGADFQWGDALTKGGIALAAAVVGRLILWANSSTDAQLLAFPRKGVAPPAAQEQQAA